MAELSRVKLTLGLEDDTHDAVLSLLLERCETWVRGVCGIFDMGEDRTLLPLAAPLDDAVEALCVVRYNKLGSEGLSTEAVGPLSMNYSDIPADTARILDRWKRLRF
ncbi:MAG: phage head-tail connector protein [Clostridiales bacterium]|jgi:hypothetical protein|nr:phage head-tail connector protein [Clostridiales bacterium]